MQNRLKVLRAERNWSQEEVARRLDVSRQAVNAVETGRHDPSLPLAFLFAELFETTIEEVFEPDRDANGVPVRKRQSGSREREAKSAST